MMSMEGVNESKSVRAEEGALLSLGSTVGDEAEGEAVVARERERAGVDSANKPATEMS